MQIFFFVLGVLTPISGYPLLLDPVIEAAESLGYQVVGELEFRPGEARPDRAQMKKGLQVLSELCPRTQAWDQSITSRANFVVMAWADHEFPSHKIKNLSVDKVLLAQTRAQKTAQYLRESVRGELNFEVVNMATRKPHFIQPAEFTQHKYARADIKHTLELAGAAPSDAFSVGLFGEYSQKSKAVIWVECFENLVKQRANAIPQISVAWGNLPETRVSNLD